MLTDYRQIKGLAELMGRVSAIEDRLENHQDAEAGTENSGAGLPPATEEDYNKFLRGDGTWATPECGGDTGLSKEIIPKIKDAFEETHDFESRFAVAPFGEDDIYKLDLSNLITDTSNIPNRYAQAPFSENDGISGIDLSNLITDISSMPDVCAVAPFSDEDVNGIDLSTLVDGTNFEYNSDRTSIQSGNASHNVNNGISRGYVKINTPSSHSMMLTVNVSISSQSSYDYGGCIITENEPNTTFTLSNLSASSTWIRVSGTVTNKDYTYILEPGKVYYLNFGYAKNASTNTGNDRFYINKIIAKVMTDFEFNDDKTCIQSGGASYNIKNGISRGYVKIDTPKDCAMMLTVNASISSYLYDYGGCIITKNKPNTAFTINDLKASQTWMKISGTVSEKSYTYMLEAGQSYYLNFGYAKSGSTNNGNDRFCIHSIITEPVTDFEYGPNMEYIQSGSKSYKNNDGASRGYIKIDPLPITTELIVRARISSETARDYGGCIVTEDEPDASFSFATLKDSNFFSMSGYGSTEVKTYKTELYPNRTYYLNFAYLKNNQTNSGDDRFYIYSVRLNPIVTGTNKYDIASNMVFTYSGELADTVTTGLAGKMISANTSRTIMNNKSEFEELENKYMKFLERARTYYLEEKRGNYSNPLTFYEGTEIETTIRVEEVMSETPLKYTDQYGSTGLEWYYAKSIKLTSSRSTSTASLTADNTQNYIGYYYYLYKLSDCTGLIIRDGYYAKTGGFAAITVQPFLVNATGTISLGTAITVTEGNTANTAKRTSMYIIPSMTDEKTLTFFSIRETYKSFSASAGPSDGYIEKYSYITICFNTSNNTAATVDSLTALGTYDTESLTIFSGDYARGVHIKSLKRIGDTIRMYYSPGNVVVDGVDRGLFQNGTKTYPFLYAETDVYKNDSNGVPRLNSCTLKEYFLHGIYRSASKVKTVPVTINADKVNYPWNAITNNRNIIAVSKDRRNGYLYLISLSPENRVAGDGFYDYPYSSDWYDKIFKVSKVEPNIPDICAVDIKFSEIIDYLII